MVKFIFGAASMALLFGSALSLLTSVVAYYDPVTNMPTTEDYILHFLVPAVLAAFAIAVRAWAKFFIFD